MLSTSTPFSHFNPLRPCGRRLISANFGDASDEFQSTPPVWAETSMTASTRSNTLNFNPLRPCGRRPIARPPPAYQCRISIHSARVGGDRKTRFSPANSRISIHSARVGGDAPGGARGEGGNYFNPLRPCGRRQQKKPFFRLLSISITTYFTEKSKRTRCKFSHLGYLFQYSLLILVRTSLYVDV